MAVCGAPHPEDPKRTCTNQTGDEFHTTGTGMAQQWWRNTNFNGTPSNNPLNDHDIDKTHGVVVGP